MRIRTIINSLILATLILALPGWTAVKNSAPYPVIFVHGIGDSSVAWKITGPAVSSFYNKYYKTDQHPFFSSGSGVGKDRDDKDFKDNLRNSCVYVTFTDYYASPASQVPELKKVIEDTRQEVWENFPSYFKSEEEVKVVLVAHSMGGLACRNYLVENSRDHHIFILITIDTPNNGVGALSLKWMPYILDAGGAAGAVASANPLLLGFSAVGIGADVMLHSSGIRLLSPAADSLQVGSEFLKELNSQPLPEEVKYRAVISNSTDFPFSLYNRLFGFNKGGDGAISIESQGLANAGIPNFERLDYKEYLINSPHFESPTRAGDTIVEILGFD